MSVARACLLAVAVLAALILPATSLAQEARVTTQVDTTELTVGDRITFSVSIFHPNESEIVWPDSLSLPPFEILGASVEPPTSSAGFRTSPCAG